MRIVDANAAIRVGRWALRNHDHIPAHIRADIALLAERAGQKLQVGLFAVELAQLRGEPHCGVVDVHLPEDGDHQ